MGLLVLGGKFLIFQTWISCFKHFTNFVVFLFCYRKTGGFSNQPMIVLRREFPFDPSVFCCGGFEGRIFHSMYPAKIMEVKNGMSPIVAWVILSLRVIFYFHDYGMKSIAELNKREPQRSHQKPTPPLYRFYIKNTKRFITSSPYVKQKNNKNATEKSTACVIRKPSESRSWTYGEGDVSSISPFSSKLDQWFWWWRKTCTRTQVSSTFPASLVASVLVTSLTPPRKKNRTPSTSQ